MDLCYPNCIGVFLVLGCSIGIECVKVHYVTPHVGSLAGDTKLNIYGEECVKVHYVTPNVGSLAGDTKLTIYGEGVLLIRIGLALHAFSVFFQFSAFNALSNDVTLGNRVYLAGESGNQFECPIQEDETIETQIRCNTPSHMSAQKYYVNVVVDGEAVTDICGGNPTSYTCSYTPSWSKTPMITWFRPRSGLAGTVVTMGGRFITDRFGVDITRRKDTSSTGRTEKLLRVTVGPLDCNLFDGTELYGLTTTEIKCLTQGSSVGFFNASLIVSGAFGMSLIDPLQYRVSYKDDIYLYQTYTEITSVHPNVVSTEGGAIIRVYIDHVDDRPPYTAPTVFVGDTECMVTSVVVDEYIECEIATDPRDTGSQLGNRGVTLEKWDVHVSDIADILDLTENDPGYTVVTIDEMLVETAVPCPMKMTAFFTPPHSGRYEFVIFAYRRATLYVNEIVTVDNEFSSRSHRVNLVQGTRYLLEFVHQSSNAFVNVEFFDTEYTDDQLGAARQESQMFRVRSTKHNEIQELTFSEFVQTNPITEVQLINISTEHKFRLGLYGVYTEPLELMTLLENNDTVSEVFNALPIFAENENVTVIQTAKPDGISLQFTFESGRGDFPDIEVIPVYAGNNIFHNVTEEVKGRPDMETVSLTFAGRVSEPFSVSSLDDTKIAAVIGDMFVNKCPDIFSESAIEFTDYENGAHSYMTDAFCGKMALKNPTTLYQRSESKGVDITEDGNRFVCFAYKGRLWSHIHLKYSYFNDDPFGQMFGSTHFTHRFSITSVGTWSHTCFDMYERLFGLVPNSRKFNVHRIAVASSRRNTIFIDTFYIGTRDFSDDPDISFRRLSAAMPNGVLFASYSVSITSPAVYKVTMVPVNCGHNFPFFELTNGEDISKTAFTSDNVKVSRLSNGGQGSLSVARLQSASPPVSGHVDINFGNSIKTNLDITMTPSNFKRELETLNGIGSLSISKSGDCANFDYIVNFVTLTGDLPEMKVNYEKIGGRYVVITTSTRWNGSLKISPIPGDMLTTVHSKPQVRAYINGVPTACLYDCTVEWDSVITPTVASIEPTFGTSALGTVLTITGTRFSKDTGGNIVAIGGVDCLVTTSTDSMIVCGVGNGPVGSYKINVKVIGNGYAVHTDGDNMFEYTANIDSIFPINSHLGGGLTLTISGYGFKSGSSVTINSRPCKVQTNAPDKITCILPTQEAAAIYPVVLFSGLTTLTYSSILYVSNQDLVITSISAETIPVGGGSLLIFGSGFGNNPSEVYVGNQLVSITSWRENEIIIDIGPIDPGIHEVKVQMDTGYPLYSNNILPTIYAELVITNVFPQWGSIQGGTYITVTGSGFGNDPGVVDISLGNVPCGIQEIQNEKLVCVTDNAATVHHVTNGGVDPAYGIYFAFDKPYITIKEGDFVDWSWATPTFVNNVKHAILEIDSPATLNVKTGCFNSGAPKSNGQFRHQFTKTGIYYVWSGYVDAYMIKNYLGTINVVDATSSAKIITLKVHGKDAQHNVGAAPDPTDTSNCPPLTDGMDLCLDPRPSGDGAERFFFDFWTCSTPVIKGIEPRNGTVQTIITVHGQGLSTTSCQNEVMFGSSQCLVSYSSPSSLICSWDKSKDTELGVLQPLRVRVGNRGNALVSLMTTHDQSFGILPNVENIQPNSGSLAGGAVITISGYGFGSEPMIRIGGYECIATYTSFSEIHCKTPFSRTSLSRDVEVSIMINGVPVSAHCETESGTCQYTYSESLTPTVSSIYPTTMYDATEFIVHGTELGAISANVEVLIGGIKAKVLTVTSNELTFTIDAISVGINTVIVRRFDVGQAEGSLAVTGTSHISSVYPTSGSIHGQQTITIKGHGFVGRQTSVTLDGLSCDIMSVKVDEIVIISPAHIAGAVDLGVTSNFIQYETMTYFYDDNTTPTIVSIHPDHGLAGTILTIKGAHFVKGDVSVSLGEVACSIKASSETEIQCIAGDHETGSVTVYLHVEAFGASNADVQFEYQLSVDNISPTQGGLGGGQKLTVTGTGYTADVVVTVCGQVCTFIHTTTTHYICKTPALSEQKCSVTVFLNGLEKPSALNYMYRSNLTPTISSVTPTRGGTGGGFTITISGTGFGTDLSAVEVSLDGSSCKVQEVTDTTLLCIAGSHSGPIRTKVEVEICSNGIAQESSLSVVEFEYIDTWSSPFTWGGGPLPSAGEMVVIPAGHTVLLDTDTPVLKVILIQGGTLVFDERDIKLNAEIILITDNGALQVGTESQPFQHKATITLHGHVRSKNLPIYGTKCIAVRHGKVDLHGSPFPIVWTRLAATAQRESTSITLTHPVSWNLGDKIVIATTGHLHSQSDNEQRSITAVSADGMTLTLDSPLSATHAGTEELFSGTLVEFRGEVGLLTRNVVVRGNTDPQWEEHIDACSAGFNTGQFATQTCFLGRYGEEMGSSHFGAHVILHTAEMNSQQVIAKFSYVEFTFVGQAFRLGRYPLHFHMNGDMSQSFIRGCSIHKSFNRAVNIHGSHNTLVENNVIYDIKGGAFFLEDGIETGNIFQYNLAVFVQGSSSLLNSDVTPASFQVTNPDNIVQHNAAAGGTHFGYWYLLHTHPDGPSTTKNVCCKHVSLGVFYNNSAHSFGWYGLWVFPNYFPTNDGCGGRKPIPAVFQMFFSWNNNKGAESVNSWTLQFDGLILVQNRLVGYEGMFIICKEVPIEDGPMVKNSLIVGTTSVIAESTQGCTHRGLIVPKGTFFQLSHVTFVNFAESGCLALYIPPFSLNLNSGAIVMADNTNTGLSSWEKNNIIEDKDGTLTNRSQGGQILLASGILPKDCRNIPNFIPGSILTSCPFHSRLHKFTFVIITPQKLVGKNLTLINSNGNTTIPFVTGSWTGLLVSGEEYDIIWEDAGTITNITLHAAINGLSVTDSIIFNIQLTKYPDQFSIDGRKTKESDEVVTFNNANNGDWEWLRNKNKIRFIVKGTKQSLANYVNCQYPHYLRLYVVKCIFPACILPPDPEKTRPISNPGTTDLSPREATIANGCMLWHTKTLWMSPSNGFITADLNVKEPYYGLPRDRDNVFIPCCLWVKINNTDISKLGILKLEGILEICENYDWHYELNVEVIIIRGGRLIAGWPDDPFDVATLSIVLRGNLSTRNYTLDRTEKIGSKTIAVFGGLDLFGNTVHVTWTRLAVTAPEGSTQIVLREPVTWSVGDEIVIGPTGYNPTETETFRIIDIAADRSTITLNTTLKKRHIGHTETINGQLFEPSAPVGLLTRTVKITGEQYDGWENEKHGPSLQVGLHITDDRIYRGYARLSNVEFVRTGQFKAGRPSVSYMNTAIVDDIRPSMLTNCSFTHSFFTAVGVSGLRKLEISHNVIAYTENIGIQASSNDTMIQHNLVTGVTGSFGIDSHKADRVHLHDNMIAGTRTFGVNFAPLQCSESTDLYKNNWVQSGRTGFTVFPGQSLTSSSCVLIKGFNFWKNRDFGVYYNNKVPLMIEECTFAENGNGIMTFVVGPPAARHLREDKFVKISNSLIVGTTTSFDCSIDGTTVRGSNTIGAPNGGMIGVVFSGFSSSSNLAPKHAWTNILSYPAIAGRTILTGVTFANFRPTTCNGAFAVATNKNNDDGQHPLESTKITLVNVDEKYLIAYHEPNLRKINPADCLDMDCDGLKKALFKDLDGSFLGSAGSVIPYSEYEWNGDPRRGLGDYRIPQTMVTHLDGTRIPFGTLMPHKGIIRNDNCDFISSWGAYRCLNTNFQMLILESLDSDSETRRLSPVAILGNGYIDLINGPQDHGWCSHYMCRKRLSTFMAIVATDEEYLVHFTSTTPRNMRYHLLYADQNAGIKLSVWYQRSNRLDVYVDDTYIISTNAEINQLGYYVNKLGKGSEYIPTIDNSTGTNYFDRDSGLLSVIIKGPSIIDVVTAKTIILSFGLPAMSADDFYGENIIENLAGFFNIPLTNVRVVNVLSASGASTKRRRRQVEHESGSGYIIGVDLEIGDGPNTTTTLNNTDLSQLALNIANECQLGNIQRSFNTSGYCENISVPPGAVLDTAYTYLMQRPAQLIFHDQPIAYYEGQTLIKQPTLYVLDNEGVFVSVLGTVDYPWQVTACIKSGTGHPEAALSGTLSVTSVQGWFNFTDLKISHMGLGYVLEFLVVWPDMASSFTAQSVEFTVAGPQIKASVLLLNNGVDLEPYTPFSMALDLRDGMSRAMTSNSSWTSHTWTATARILGSPRYATLEGTTTVTFDPQSGQGIFNNLQISGHGVYYIQFRIQSTPRYYDFTVNHKFMIKNTEFRDQTLSFSKTIELKFDSDYHTMLYNVDIEHEFEQFISEDFIYQFPKVNLIAANIARGSIKVVFEIAANDTTFLDTVLYSLCDSIYNGSTYIFHGNKLTLSPYMLVDNIMFYGEICHGKATDDTLFEVWMMVLIVVGSVVVITLLVAIIVWRKYAIKKHDTLDTFTTKLRLPSVSSSVSSPRRTSTILPIVDALSIDDESVAQCYSPPYNTRFTFPSSLRPDPKPAVTITVKPFTTQEQKLMPAENENSFLSCSTSI